MSFKQLIKDTLPVLTDGYVLAFSRYRPKHVMKKQKCMFYTLLAVLIVGGSMWLVSDQKTDSITVQSGMSMSDLETYVSIYTIGLI